MNKLAGVLDDLFDLAQRGLEALRRLARTRRGGALILLGLAAPVCCLVLGIGGYALLSFMRPAPAATQAPPPQPTNVTIQPTPQAAAPIASPPADAAPAGELFLPLVARGEEAAAQAQPEAAEAPESELGTGQQSPPTVLPTGAPTGPPPTPTPPEEAPTATFLPQPTARGGVEAEIGFWDKQVEAQAITLTISVYNYGGASFTLYAEDVHLLPPGQGPVGLTSSSPALPFSFGLGVTQQFTFTFPNPGGSGIVFQIFNVEFDLDDF
jgi:hypothetical protein